MKKLSWLIDNRYGGNSGVFWGVGENVVFHSTPLDEHKDRKARRAIGGNTPATKELDFRSSRFRIVNKMDLDNHRDSGKGKEVLCSGAIEHCSPRSEWTCTHLIPAGLQEFIESLSGYKGVEEYYLEVAHTRDEWLWVDVADSRGFTVEHEKRTK